MPQTILPAMLPPHPRLLAAPKDWARLRGQLATDPVSAALWSTLHARADSLLSQPVLDRTMTGRRLLMVSREALDRLIALAMVANITGEARYAERGRQELLAVARFADWNPSHFLDVGEMSLAVAIGYDWLFDHLSDAERGEIAAAIVEKGIQPSLDPTAPHNWWHDATENWNQVCHGGLGAAAIAIAEREPDLCETILRRSLAKLPFAAASYAPDGVYPEGPMYWNYGTNYHVILCAALLGATGESWGLDAFPGFAGSADFMAEFTAPSGDFFNFGDCAARRRLQVPLFWMARHFGRPRAVAYDLSALHGELEAYSADPSQQYGYYSTLGLALLWHDPTLLQLAEPAPQSWQGQGHVPVAVLRSGDLYVAAKGGSAAVSHAHMDAGSFILESQGVRWVVDPGMQDYESLERAGVDLWNQEQDSERWQVFRIGADAHSILRFDNAAQQVAGNAALISSATEAGQAIFDLSSVYAPAVSRVLRGLRIAADNVLLIQDEWSTDTTAETARWQLLTEAEVSVSGHHIVLAASGKMLHLSVLDAGDATITVTDVSVPRRSSDFANPGLKRIEVACPATQGLIRVLATPTATHVPVTLTPLAHW